MHKYITVQTSLDFKVFDKHNRPASIIEAKDINPTINAFIKKVPPKAEHPWRKYAQIAIANKAGKIGASPHIPTGPTGLSAVVKGF